MKMMSNICALCKNEGNILNSHIIPEFMYKPIYDDKHRLFLRKNGFIVKTKPNQKGIREKLLCKNCEAQLSVYEKYVREILFSGIEINIKKFSNRIILSGLDYAKVRLFFLSLIWRMSVASKHDMWRNVDLGPHQEIIRDMILSEKPGTQWDYSFLSIIPLFNGTIVDDWILEPDWVRTKSGRFYNLIVGGCIYLFHVSKQHLEKEAGRWLIHPDGTWAISMKNADKIQFLRYEAEKIFRAEKYEA